MKWNNISIVFVKELRDMLRDRRTLISTVVVPTILMPGLTFMALFVTYRVINRARTTVPAVMVLGGNDSPKLRGALTASHTVRIVPPAGDWKQRVADKTIRAVVEIPAGFDAGIANAQAATVKIYDYAGELHSGFAVAELRRILSEYRDQVLRTRLAAAGLPPRFATPFEIGTENVAPPEKVGGNAIGSLIPYFFLLLSFTGAMYPALDLSAGEKERGTMETLLCSPVPRIDLVLGKFLTIFTISLATVVCSLVSTGVTLAITTALVGSDAGGAGGNLQALTSIDRVGFAFVVVMVIPMAVLFAAVQFAIALFAKSFKEAQSYVSPLAIMIVIPAVIGILPGVELNARLALVPILNVSLVSRELVSGVWHWQYLSLIFGSTCLYAIAALVVAVRMFEREDVIFRT